MPGAYSADWLRGDGQMALRIREFDWSATPLGPIEAWPASLKIAVQRATEEALPERESRFRNFVIASADAIYCISPDWSGIRKLDNRGLLSDTTAPIETWMERYIATEDQAEVRASIERAIATKSTFEFERRVRRRNSDTGWILSRAVPILDEDGEITEWLGTASDITARKQSEEALRQSEKQLSVELAQTAVLRGLSERLVTEDRLPEIFEEILFAAITITGSDAGTVQVYDPEIKALVLLVTKGFTRHMTDHFNKVDAGSQTACGMALRTGERAFIDFDDDNVNIACRMHVDAGYRSAQATPLLSRSGAPIGMLNTHWREPRHRPSDSQLRFLDLLARQAADLIVQRRA
jgi:PAS domain-containing protein